MNAIRQIVEVKDHKIKIDLPKGFDADLVEVIIFPKVEEEFEFEISEEEKNIMRDRLLDSDPSKFQSWREIREKYL